MRGFIFHIYDKQYKRIISVIIRDNKKSIKAISGDKKLANTNNAMTLFKIVPIIRNLE